MNETIELIAGVGAVILRLAHDLKADERPKAEILGELESAINELGLSVGTLRDHLEANDRDADAIIAADKAKADKGGGEGQNQP